MFGGYQKISRATASLIASSVRPANPSPALENILVRLGSDEPDRATDIARTEREEGLDPTTREALIGNPPINDAYHK